MPKPKAASKAIEPFFAGNLSNFLPSLNEICERHEIDGTVKQRVLRKLVEKLSTPNSPVPSRPRGPEVEAEKGDFSRRAWLRADHSQPSLLRREPSGLAGLRKDLSRTILPKAEDFQPILMRKERSCIDLVKKELSQTTLVRSNPRFAGQAKPIGALPSRAEQLEATLKATKRSELGCLPRMRPAHDVKTLSSFDDPPSNQKGSATMTELGYSVKPYRDLRDSAEESIPQLHNLTFSSNLLSAKDFACCPNFYSQSELSNSFADPLDAKSRSIFGLLDRKGLGRIGIDNLDISALTSDDLSLIEGFVLLVYQTGRSASFSQKNLLDFLRKTRRDPR